MAPKWLRIKANLSLEAAQNGGKLFSDVMAPAGSLGGHANDGDGGKKGREKSEQIGEESRQEENAKKAC